MSTKKKIWISAISLVVIIGVVFAGIALFKTGGKAKNISAEEAQALVNKEFDAIASTEVTKFIAENNEIVVNSLSYGDEKNVILECTIKTIDVHSAVSPSYDEFMSAEAKDNLGMYKSRTVFRKEFSNNIIALLEDEEKTEASCTIQIFDTEEGYKVYTDPAVVDIIYGSSSKISEDISGRTTFVDEFGETKQIGSTNVTRGFIECFNTKYDSAKPDTGTWLSKKITAFKDDFHRIFISHGRWKTIFKGLGVTLQLTFFALLIGVLIGFVIAFIRCTADKLPKKNLILSLLNQIAKLYISIIRGTPAMVQIMIIYFVIFMPMGVSKFVAAVVCFGLNSGAYVAEIVRGGIMSVDEGQTEAGRSLGFGYMSTMFYIILPQAFKAVLPALANEFIVLLKETSIAFYIGLGDLMYSVNAIRAATYTQFMPLIAAAIIYLVMVLVLSKLVSILERKLRNNER